jgi:hypothetical protein
MGPPGGRHGRAQDRQAGGRQGLVGGLHGGHVPLPGDLGQPFQEPGRNQRHVAVDAEGHLFAGHAQAGEGQAELFGAGEGADQLVVARRHVGRSQAQ